MFLKILVSLNFSLAPSLICLYAKNSRPGWSYGLVKSEHFCQASQFIWILKSETNI